MLTWGRQKLLKVLAADGMGPCWGVVVFLSTNNVFIDHLNSIELPPDASYYLAQYALQTMVKRLYDTLDTANRNLEIEYVCLFGGRHRQNDHLSTLGYMVKTLCSSRSEVLLFKTNAAIQNRLLEFMNKVVYIDLNMNSASQSSNEESDVTIIVESVGNIRRVSLIMYVGDKALSVYVLDPAKSRPNLFFKSLNSPITIFENNVQNKKMNFMDYRSLNLLFPGTPMYHIYVQTTLLNILNNLIPRIMIDESDEEEELSDSDLPSI
jgi:hypothetical protein